MKRKRNPGPLGFLVPGDPGYTSKKSTAKGRKTKIKQEKRAHAERKRIIKMLNYKDRAKRMRPFFKDMFSAKSGFDLRAPKTWTPQQKAKVTKYFGIVAPNITGDFVVKRYRIPKNTAAAIDASLQERPLKGQTAVAFRVDPGEKLEIKVKDGVATVKQHGLKRIKLKFDKKAFLRDPEAEVNRVLSQTDAQVFRVLTGGQGQNITLKRNDVMAEIARLTARYKPSKELDRQHQRPFTEWLNGLIAYPGTKKQTYSTVDKFVRRHKAIMDKKRQDHFDKVSAESKNITVKELRRKRTKREKAKGRR